MIVVFDVETEGLQPQSRILEATYMHLDPISLEVLEQDSAVVRQRDFDPSRLPPKVREMHAENGLLDELLGRATNPLVETVLEGDTQLDNWLCHAFRGLEAQPASIYLLGNSIQFDRGKLLTYCPNASNFLIHRQIDLSTIRELLRFWEPLGAPQLPKEEPKHRSRADCSQAVRNLRWMRDNVFPMRNLARIANLRYALTLVGSRTDDPSIRHDVLEALQADSSSARGTQTETVITPEFLDHTAQLEKVRCGT